MLPFHLLLAALFGWLQREQRDAIDFLREENRVLKSQLCGRLLRQADDLVLALRSSRAMTRLRFGVNPLDA